jgi:hypothetical protein
VKPIYDAALRDTVRMRMSPPNRESVSAIARDTGIAIPTLYSWRSQWKKTRPAGARYKASSGTVERGRQTGGSDSKHRHERPYPIASIVTASSGLKDNQPNYYQFSISWSHSPFPRR